MNEAINNYIEKINNKLNEYLENKYADRKYVERIYDAMAYSVNAGGKRLRPMLCLLACEAVGGDKEKALPFAAALEMIHTYSLIHDDLPAMDNDDLRRGKPTNHKMFDEATAILAGDGLLNFAYEIMAEEIMKNNDMKLIKAFKIISEKAGVRGMVGGQVVDTQSEGKDIDRQTLIYIHKNKTAALITAALLAGAYIGEADGAQERIFELVGEKMGIAFQIKDDILDITGTTEVLGKPVLSDEKNEKTTYVSLFGMEKAIADYERLSEESLSLVSKISDENSLFYGYIKSLVDRKY